MQEFLVSIVLIIITYILYLLWIRPLKIMKTYVKNLKKLGYNVLQVPYNPFKNDMISTMKQGMKKGDALKLYKQDRRDYDVIVSNTLNRPRLQFHHPDFIKDFYSIDKHYQYPKTSNVVQVFSKIAGGGLFFSQGEFWRRKRSIFNKIFNFDFVMKQTHKISVICDDAINQIQSQYKNSQSPNVFQFPVLKLTTRIFSNVMIQIFLGGSKQQLIEGQPAGFYLQNLIADYSTFAFSPLNFALGPKFLNLGITKNQKFFLQKINKYRQWGFGFVRKKIQLFNKQYLKNPQRQPSDIIEALLVVGKNSCDEKFAIGQKQIFQQFTSFFIAGTDTTSNFTQMMIYQIAKNENIERKVREQIQMYIKQEDYSFQNLKNLKYIEMIQKEISRTYGPINTLFSRKCKVDNYLNGLPIKKDTGISISFIGNHFSEKYFKSPYEFRPQRWENECDNIPTYAIGGFGGGARTCIGKHLALMQSKIALAKFMKRYDKIILPKKDYKMPMKFIYGPEQFSTKLFVKQS